jgi:hypothetical protein
LTVRAVSILPAILSIFLLTVAAGCVEVHRATGPYFQEAVRPQGSEAIIYFYRLPLRTTSRYKASRIYDADRPIGLLDNGGYFVFTANPGGHRFSIDKIELYELWLELAGGRTYFIKWDFIERSMNLSKYGAVGGQIAAVLLRRVDEAQALEELRGCQLMETENE